MSSQDNRDQNSHILSAIEILENFSHNHSDFIHIDLIVFLKEQLKLTLISHHSRIYPRNVMIKSFLWHCYSPALYQQLRELFILPTVRRLRQISCTTISRFSSLSIDKEYFRTRTSTLTDIDRHVVMQIDEIYSAQRVEYSGGDIVGVASDGSAAKTVLAFMVNSLSSKYDDILLLIPVHRLTSTQLKESFISILNQIKEFFLVVGISTDNLSTNR